MSKRWRMTKEHALSLLCDPVFTYEYSLDVLHLLINSDNTYSFGHHPDWMECAVCRTQGNVVGQTDIDIIPRYEVFRGWLNENS